MCVRLQGRSFQLCEVRLLRQRGADALLEIADSAALCFIVKDDYTMRPDQAQSGPVVTFSQLQPVSTHAEGAAKEAASRSSNGASSGEARESVSACDSSNGGEEMKRREEKLWGSASEPQAVQNRRNAVEWSQPPEESPSASSRSIQGSGLTNRTGNVYSSRGSNSIQSAVDGRMPPASSGNSNANATCEVDSACSGGALLLEHSSDAPAECTSLGMDTEQERGILRHLLAECEAALSQFSSSIADDQQILCSNHYRDASSSEDPRSVEQHEGHRAQGKCPSDNLEAGYSVKSVRKEKLSGSGSGKQESARDVWFAECHLRMAVQYRLQRKLLLARVAEDLNAQLMLLS